MVRFILRCVIFL